MPKKNSLKFHKCWCLENVGFVSRQKHFAPQSFHSSCRGSWGWQIMWNESIIAREELRIQWQRLRKFYETFHVGWNLDEQTMIRRCAKRKLLHIQHFAYIYPHNSLMLTESLIFSFYHPFCVVFLYMNVMLILSFLFLRFLLPGADGVHLTVVSEAFIQICSNWALFRVFFISFVTAKHFLLVEQHCTRENVYKHKKRYINWLIC